MPLNLDCAQCHDHPFSRWKQEQFWQFAAFFAAPKGDRIELGIPQTDKVVAATLPTGDKLKWPAKLERDSGRKTLAAWVTAKDNPYFARNAVNLVWAQLFGTGLVEPLDDLSDSNPASHPKLLDDLAGVFVASGHDLKFLLRVLTRTRAYQLSSRGRKQRSSADYRLFAVAAVRGLSGEQLYDSLRIASGLPLPPDDEDGGPRPSPRRQFALRFLSDRPAKSQRSVLQALELMNGPAVREAVTHGKTVSAAAEAPFLDARGRIELLFLAALGRQPSAGEMKEMLAHVGTDEKNQKKDRLADVFWALLNSTEFSVNH